MRFSVSGAVLALISLGAVTQANPAEDVENFVRNYESSLEGHKLKCREETTCTPENTRVRKSWYDLTTAEKGNWFNAVKCLQGKPSITPASEAPGARHRLDDFTVSHNINTLTTHACGWFLPWHRYFVWQFETALIEECGYTGATPYWDWTVHAGQYDEDPIFDGTVTSFGTNGQYVEQERVNATMPGLPDPVYIVREPGTGGGCVTDGAFGDLELNLGMKFPYGDHASTGLDYSPRCLTRSWNIPLATAVLTSANVAAVLSQTTLAGFLNTLDTSVHPVGHDAVGGDVADLFNSPQDPLFYLHHAQVDRLWTVWQAQDPTTRITECSNTQTMFNSPPSAPAALTDQIPFGHVGGWVELGDLVNPLAGPLCYRYE